MVRRPATDLQVTTATAADAAALASLRTRVAADLTRRYDLRYFTTVGCAVYLHDLAVEPGRQRQGIGRHLIEQATDAAAAWPADAIRLDAYDHPAGAGPFYTRCVSTTSDG